ncbi:hypothetical protein C7C46_05880 [Streptomyces tateyamensis]|uniref:Uncharacterized protein n=1 Tax=Streptomyces tateyamensis TaxID=565073 RepID=A0A2V4NKQ5_9ACTN|nr:hypothetical protein [Streptomyces tateyamensis]PYC86163.1 hypothetical protein C7C46_05880 [Streptomyces tateyamensis]
MPIRDELPPRTGPWATRFDSGEGLVLADEVLRAAALKDHDLAPIMPFRQLYGPPPAGDAWATGFGIDPQVPYGPGGEVNYVRADFSTGFVYGVYRPAPALVAAGPAGAEPGAGAGPQRADDLLLTTAYPYPGGRIDPLRVPLAELGLDVPGVDGRFVRFCAGVLGVEAADDLGELREGFAAAWPDYRETVRAGLVHLVRERPLGVDQWYGLTYIGFPDVQALTGYLAQVYAYLFDGFDAMPVAPH